MLAKPPTAPKSYSQPALDYELGWLMAWIFDMARRRSGSWMSMMRSRSTSQTGHQPREMSWSELMVQGVSVGSAYYRHAGTEIA